MLHFKPHPFIKILTTITRMFTKKLRSLFHLGKNSIFTIRISLKVFKNLKTPPQFYLLHCLNLIKQSLTPDIISHLHHDNGEILSFHNSFIGYRFGLIKYKNKKFHWYKKFFIVQQTYLIKFSVRIPLVVFFFRQFFE